MSKDKSATTHDGQYDSFVKAARELKTNGSEAAFDQVLKKVGSAKPAPIKKPEKVGKPKRG